MPFPPLRHPRIMMLMVPERPECGVRAHGSAMSPQPRSATDGDPAGTAVAATAGERLARALAAKDRDALCALLAGPVDFQALTPRRHWQASTGGQVVKEIILAHWFGAGDHIVELCSVATGRVSEREHVVYPRMADGARRLHVGEVGDGLQRGVEFRPVSRTPRAGSAPMTASQLLTSSRPANTDAAWPAKTSTICGSNCVPRRCLASTEMAQHEQRAGGGGGEIDPAEVGLERRVVTEPLRLLVGVDVASHPGQQGGVVTTSRSASDRPSRWASRRETRHWRRTCSIGWPMPRSAASDRTASSSARLTPGRAAGCAVPMNIRANRPMPVYFTCYASYRY